MPIDEASSQSGAAATAGSKANPDSQSNSLLGNGLADTVDGLVTPILQPVTTAVDEIVGTATPKPASATVTADSTTAVDQTSTAGSQPHSISTVVAADAAVSTSDSIAPASLVDQLVYTVGGVTDQILQPAAQTIDAASQVTAPILRPVVKTVDSALSPAIAPGEPAPGGGPVPVVENTIDTVTDVVGGLLTTAPSQLVDQVSNTLPVTEPVLDPVADVLRPTPSLGATVEDTVTTVTNTGHGLTQTVGTVAPITQPIVTPIDDSISQIPPMVQTVIDTGSSGLGTVDQSVSSTVTTVTGSPSTTGPMTGPGSDAGASAGQGSGTGADLGSVSGVLGGVGKVVGSATDTVTDTGSGVLGGVGQVVDSVTDPGTGSGNGPASDGLGSGVLGGAGQVIGSVADPIIGSDANTGASTGAGTSAGSGLGAGTVLPPEIVANKPPAHPSTSSPEASWPRTTAPVTTARIALPPLTANPTIAVTPAPPATPIAPARPTDLVARLVGDLGLLTGQDSARESLPSSAPGTSPASISPDQLSTRTTFPGSTGAAMAAMPSVAQVLKQAQTQERPQARAADGHGANNTEANGAGTPGKSPVDPAPLSLVEAGGAASSSGASSGTSHGTGGGSAAAIFLMMLLLVLAVWRGWLREALHIPTSVIQTVPTPPG